jgi:hypothetical protein
MLAPRRLLLLGRPLEDGGDLRLVVSTLGHDG